MKGYDEIEESARADTEITLGPRSILGIFFALALICGVFFGFGYSLGRSGGAKSAAAALARTQTTATPQPATPLQTVVEQSGANAPAGNPGSSATALQSADVSSDASSPSKPSAATAAPPTPAATVIQSTSAPAAQPVAYSPAPVAKVAPAQHETSYAASKPASRPTEIMVQIAAVSRRQDAEVLVAALRRHGYTPVVHPGVDDHLLHVQVGPFPTRDAAREMRARLLRNGYNAIVK